MILIFTFIILTMAIKVTVISIHIADVRCDRLYDAYFITHQNQELLVCLIYL